MTKYLFDIYTKLYIGKINYPDDFNINLENAVDIAPIEQNGYVPYWNGNYWELKEKPSFNVEYEEIIWDNELKQFKIIRNNDKAIKKLREIRNKLLSETDWFALRHQDEIARGMQTTLTEEQYQELLNYRQSLRDLPEDPNLDVFNPQFPQKPSWMK
jgi:hypothetical protein